MTTTVSAAAGGSSGAPHQHQQVLADDASIFNSSMMSAVTMRTVWKKDTAVKLCERCHRAFTFYRRRHHCRRCGGIYCGDCASDKVSGISGWSGAERVCKICLSIAPSSVLPSQPRERHVIVLGAAGVGKSALTEGFAAGDAGMTSRLAVRSGSTSSEGSVAGGGGVSGGGGGGGSSLNASSSHGPHPYARTHGATSSRCRILRHSRSGVHYALVVEDTSGQPGQVHAFSPSLSVAAHAYLLVFAVEDRSTLHALTAIYERVLDCGGFFQPIVVAGTVRNETGRVVTSEEAEKVAAGFNGARYVEVSMAASDIAILFEKVLEDVHSRE